MLVLNMAHLQDLHLFKCSALYYSLILILTSSLFFLYITSTPHHDSVSSLPNGSLHILIPSFRILVLVAFATHNHVFDCFFQNFVILHDFTIVILAHLTFIIDFVQRNADYTLYTCRMRLPFRHFSCQEWGELIWQSGTDLASTLFVF